MCDTFGIKMSWSGTDGSIFGKNSDREPDETSATKPCLQR